jgi:hypothetical protein
MGQAVASTWDLTSAISAGDSFETNRHLSDLLDILSNAKIPAGAEIKGWLRGMTDAAAGNRRQRRGRVPILREFADVGRDIQYTDYRRELLRLFGIEDVQQAAERDKIRKAARKLTQLRQTKGRVQAVVGAEVREEGRALTDEEIGLLNEVGATRESFARAFEAQGVPQLWSIWDSASRWEQEQLLKDPDIGPDLIQILKIAADRVRRQREGGR